MGEESRQDILGRKATASRRAFEARAMSPAKALRRALSRAADSLWDLALVPQGMEIAALDQDGVIAALGENDLLMLLDGPEAALGIASIDRELMTGLIEVQTILQVTQMPVEDRPLTATDAAMMAPLVDGTLERFTAYLEGDPLQDRVRDFRFGAMIEDSRAAGLVLDAPGYRSFRVTVDLALGRRRGVIQFILPERRGKSSDAADDAADAPGPNESRMMLVPAQLNAVLCHVRMPLDEASALKPGDLVGLPAGALDLAELVAPGGHVTGKGRLGQMNGFRALRLSWPETQPSSAPAPIAAEPAKPAARPARTAPPAPPPPPPEEEALPDLPPLDFDLGGEATSGDFDLDENMDFAAQMALDDLPGDDIG